MWLVTRAKCCLVLARLACPIPSGGISLPDLFGMLSWVSSHGPLSGYQEQWMARTTGRFLPVRNCAQLLPRICTSLDWRHLRLGYHNRPLNSMCRARHCFIYKPDCCSEYKQIDPATFQNKQSGGFTSKECHLTSSTDSTKRHACLKMCKGPFFGGVIVLSHQASQLGMKLVMAQARPSNQRLSPGGEVLHSRHRFGRQHFEVIVVITVKGSDVIIIANQVRVRASTTHS